MNNQPGGMTNLQTGTNTGASQAGSSAFGSSRPINPSEFVAHDLKPSNASYQVLLLIDAFIGIRAMVDTDSIQISQGVV